MAAMIKHQDVVLTSDEWKTVLNTDTDQYDQSLDKLRAEVQEITQTTFYSVYKHELEQYYFEKDLTTFESSLPRRKSRYSRGLFGMGRKLLKYVFGTGTVQELQHGLGSRSRLYFKSAGLLTKSDTFHSMGYKIIT
jgi:hypothetical protein